MDGEVDPAAILERVRAICLSFEGVSEKLSHGEPAFFVAITPKATRQFATMDAYHHGAEHLSLWCAAPLGAQEALIDANPARYFRPPYVGLRGWVGVYLDTGPDWDEVASVLADAVATVTPAPKRPRGA